MLSAADLAAFHATELPQAAGRAAPKAKGNFLTHLLPTIGGIGGGVGGGAAGGALAGSAVLPGVGTAVGGLLGALLGGAAGGAGGKVAQNAVEHQKLTSGVAGQALEQGVLSAGPLRLLKGATAGAAAVKGGTGLVDALNAGGNAAVAPSLIKTAIANKLGKSSQELTSKALGLTKGQKNDILTKTGETAGAIAQKHGIKQASDVPGVTKPMYQEFTKTVSAIPGTFTKDQVAKAFESKYAPMLAEGTPLGTQAIGNSIKSEAENILKGVPAKGLTATELNAKRQAFDKLAYKAKGTDPAAYDINKQSRDVLANLIHTAADGAGVKTPSGLTLKQLGNQINKVERVGKAAAKNVEGAGGHMALGLGTTPGAIAGASGGPLGVAAGVAANKALNSNAGRQITSKIADKAAQVASRSATKGAADPFGVASIAKRSAPVGLLGALGGAQSGNSSSQTMPPMMTAATMPSNTNIDTLSQTSAPASSSPFDPANIEANIQKMIAGGANMKDVSDYVGLAGAINSLQANAAKSTTPKLNASQIQQANNAKSGLADIGTIRSMLAQNPNLALKDAIPGGGIARRLTGTTDYEAAKQNVVDVISRLRSGAAITEGEARRYMGLLPGAADTPSAATNKLARLESLLMGFADPQASSTQADLISALQGGA